MKNQNHMAGSPEKTERNQAIKDLRKLNPKLYTVNRLGRIFEMPKQNIDRVLKRKNSDKK